MDQVLSLLGAALVLFAFGGLQLGRFVPSQASYQTINLVGASMLCASGLLTQAWGFVVLNAVWAAFAAAKLVELARPGPPAA